MTSGKRLSVIIPTINEEQSIGGFIHALQIQSVDEIIIVDGGSTDRTKDIIQGFANVTLLDSTPGRGIQMAKGANVAAGEILWFLHADSFIPGNAVDALKHHLTDDYVMGCFRLAFPRKDHWGLRLSSFVTRWDKVWTTFGDQGFFMRRTDYLAVGGMPEWPMFEDVELRRRLKRIGDVSKLDLEIETSPRRFERLGVLKAQIINLILLSRYLAGACPKALSKLYWSDTSHPLRDALRPILSENEELERMPESGAPETKLP